MMKKIGVALLFVFLTTVNVVHGQGCAMCKAVAENQVASDEGGMSNGLNSGILYLMVIPYVIFLFVFRKRIIRFVKEMRDIYD